MCNVPVMVLVQTKVPVIIQLEPVFVILDSKEICVKVKFDLLSFEVSLSSLGLVSFWTQQRTRYLHLFGQLFANFTHFF